MRNILRTICAAAIALTMCDSIAWAQQADSRSNSSNAPLPPLNLATSSAQVSVQAPTQPAQADTIPDTRPLSGAEQFTLGEIPNKHSYLLPSVDVRSQADTNGASSFGSGQLVSQNSILGTLALQRTTGRSQLTLSYVGGGTVSTGGSSSVGQGDLNTVIQQFGASQTINWRRWTLLLNDQMSYLPESSFGLGQGGLGFLGPAIGGSLNGLVPNLESSLTPNQSILTPRGGRITNTVVGQVEYHLSPRSSITTTGDYGILHFLDSGLLDSNNAMFLVGYDYQVTRRDTFGVIYHFNALRFSSLDRSVDDHIAQLAYGHRIMGRLAFRLAAGPEVGLLRDSATGSSSRISWNLTSSLDYQLERTGLLLSYNRATTGGAGVLAGAETNEVRAVVSRSLSRAWRGALDLGYARNRSLDAGRGPFFRQSFNTWYGGVQLTRPIGRGADIFLGYTAQFQNSGVGFCAGGGCGRSLVRHLITLGFSWRLHPIELR
jgi:hypothetical protein